MKKKKSQLIRKFNKLIEFFNYSLTMLTKHFILYFIYLFYFVIFNNMDKMALGNIVFDAHIEVFGNIEQKKFKFHF